MNRLANIFVVVVFAIVVRWAVSLNGYSGRGIPPMYGDYEAQRHWMEITYNLPVQQWYENGTDNDLQYWGLDYPPLTAYHSWLCGTVANKINSSWVELHKSHGLESHSHKLFMRYSVLVVDLLVYFPAIILYFLTSNSVEDSTQKTYSAAVALMYPGLILIDHGHFQYNCVSLGLTAFGVLGLSTGCHLVGSAAFVLALSYKQMELYHSIPFFCYLLAMCFKGKENWFLQLVKLGVVVTGTFGLVWWPFLQDKDTFLQVVQRLLPFGRGLYEDKVANFWCSLSVLVKVKQMLNVSALVKLCLASTLIALLPSSLHLLFKPSVPRFKVALVNSALVFFLFSFQVHEKSILIPALPVCLLLPDRPFQCMWFLLISTFSMLPLLVKDGLLMPTLATCVMFYLITSLVYDEEEETPSAKGPKVTKVQEVNSFFPGKAVTSLFWVSLVGCIALSWATVNLRPPAHYPDLYAMLVSGYSCAHFLLFLAYFHWLQFTITDPVPGSKKSPKKQIQGASYGYGRKSAKSSKKIN